MSAFNSIPTVKFFVIHVSCVICNICWHSMHVRTVQQEHQDHQLAQHVIHKYVIFFFFWTNHEYVICHYFFMSFYVFIKRTNVTGLSEQQRPERERERGMDALNSTKPDDHQVVSPTRVLLHLSILSIIIGFTLSYHFFYNFFTRGGRCVAHTYIL